MITKENIINISKRNINEESENIIEEFYKADKFLQQKQTNVLTHESHSQSYHTSHLLDFTKQLNEILNQKEEYSGIFYFLNKNIILFKNITLICLNDTRTFEYRFY